MNKIKLYEKNNIDNEIIYKNNFKEKKFNLCDATFYKYLDKDKSIVDNINSYIIIDKTSDIWNNIEPFELIKNLRKIRENRANGKKDYTRNEVMDELRNIVNESKNS